jgi:hypothetical protein
MNESRAQRDIYYVRLMIFPNQLPRAHSEFCGSRREMKIGCLLDRVRIRFARRRIAPLTVTGAGILGFEPNMRSLAERFGIMLLC